MSALQPLVQRAVEQGAVLLLVTTAILGLGALAVARSRAPIHRQRLAELSVAAALVWLVLALVPLPRAAWFAEPAPAPPAQPVPHTEGLRFPGELVFLASADPEVDDMAPSGSGSSSSAVPALGVPGANVRAPLPAAGTSFACVMVWVWLAAATAGLAWLGLGTVLLARAWRRSRPASVHARALLARLTEGELLHVPALRVGAGAFQPFCFGLVRSAIFVPEALLAPAAEARLTAVLRHELAHLRQHDTRGRLLFALAQVVLGLHPLFWWLRREAHLAAELVADDVAAGATGTARYAREMIDLASLQVQWQPPLLAAAPAIRTRSEFYRRMHMLLQREGRLEIRCSARARAIHLAGTGLAVAIATACFGAVPLAAQEPEKEKEKESVIQEVSKPQDEREAMQKEIARLRDELAKLKAAADAQNPLGRIADAERFAAGKRAAGEFQAARGVLRAAQNGEAGDPVAGEAAVAVPVDEFGRKAMIEQLALVNKARGVAANGAPGAALFGVQPTATTSLGRAGTERDLLTMVNSAIDLEAELASAKAKLSQLDGLGEKGFASNDQRDEAKVKFDALMRKHKAVQTVLDAERRATEVELASTLEQRGKVEKGTREAGELDARAVRLEARLKALQMAK